MPKNLLIITQKVDENDDLLGFFTSWIAEFAKHFSRVDVIALGVGVYELPANVYVHSLGKEHESSRLERVFRMIDLLWRHTSSGGAVFAHMSPVFTLIAWPFALLRRARLVFWYLHRSNTLRLRLAIRVSNALVTADAESLTVHSPKIVSVGHGIDVKRFAGKDEKEMGRSMPHTIMSVGRISRIKDFGTLIRASALLRDREIPVRVEIIGRPVMPADKDYLQELDVLCRRLGVTDSIHFIGFVRHSDMSTRYAHADVVVGCTPPGGIDKAILEGMAAGCAVATSNTVMRKYFVPTYADDCIFQHGNAIDLADTLERLLSADMRSIGVDMQYAVTRDHNLPITIGKIVTLL